MKYREVKHLVDRLAPDNLSREHLNSIIRAFSAVPFFASEYLNPNVKACRAAEVCYRSLTLEAGSAISVENVRFLLLHFLCCELDQLASLKEGDDVPIDKCDVTNLFLKELSHNYSFMRQYSEKKRTDFLHYRM